MNLPRYAKYKGSGIDWIGELPAEWKVLPTRRVFRIVNGATPASNEEAFWNGDIPWVTPEDLSGLASPVLLETARKITRAGYESCGTSLAPAGSLILSTRAPIGSAAIAGLPVCTNQGCRCLVPMHGDESSFFFYVLVSGRPELESLGQGTTFRELSRSRLASVSVPCPPKEEQRAIVSFLDLKSAEIDELIAKNQRLIEMLKEKRTALIEQCITKGLNADVARKSSGIASVGDIPAHWTMHRNKYLYEEINVRSSDGQEDLLTVSHKNGVSRRSDRPDVTMFMAETLEDYKVCEAGDLVINTMWAWMGALGFSMQRGAVSPSYNVYRLRRPESARYLDYLYRTEPYVCEYRRFSQGVWESRLRLYPANFGQILTILPPRGEQEEIVRYLDEATADLSRLIVNILRAIEHLREYRIALITSAVTGKFDVRTYESQSPSP